MYFIGLMTGTSLDGLDATLLAADGEHYRYLDHLSLPMPRSLRHDLHALTSTGDNELQRAAVAAWQHAELCARAVHKLLAQNHLRPADIVAIGNHGQTLRHAPDHHPPYTIQLQNPARIAELTGIDVVADFRVRDIAAGGEGAPLAPLFQRGLLQLTRAIIVNIGGIANVSYLRSDGIAGYDTGPGNALLDSWIFAQRGETFDNEGAWARTGEVLPHLLRGLLSDAYFARPAPKSSGRDYFHLQWLNPYLRSHDAPADVQRTLLELTAHTVAAGILAGEADAPVILCGGGARNTFLVERLAALIGSSRLQHCPMPAQALESAGFAWLAAQFVARRPLDLHPITGGKRRILGALYPA